MVGITSIGAYVPLYRLGLKEIGRMWGSRPADGEKAVAGYDEDAITMAVAAALDCVKRTDTEADGLYFATTTSPYREKQNAAIIAGAVDLKRRCHTADFTNSLRAGSTAMKAAVDAVRGGSLNHMLVIASDSRVGAPKGRFEQILGDSAAALLIGSNDVVADIEAAYSLYNDFTDVWRTQNDRFLQSGEGRFVDEAGYMPVMLEAISGLMKENSLSSRDFSKFVFYAHDARSHAAVAKSLGLDKSQVQDPLFDRIGNTGAAAALLTLVAALEEARPGDRILFAGYGDGCDAFVFRVTEHIGKIQNDPGIKDKISKKTCIDYGKYLEWRDLIPVEASSLPERSEPSLATRWRERRTVSSLYGFKCRNCGTPQLHPNGQTMRVCVACQAKDNFEPYKFSDKKGMLFTYAVDQLQPTKNPPGLNGVIDFDGGGRMLCELTDYDLEKAKVGMRVEMTFRKLSQGKGIVNYFWKARPLV